MTDYALKEPQRGDRITADWARELVRAVRSMRLFPGPGIRLCRTPAGTTVSAVMRPGGAAAPAAPAAPGRFDYGDVTNNTYAGEVSVAGLLTHKTYMVDVLEIGLAETIPYGSRIGFHVINTAEVGGE